MQEEVYTTSICNKRKPSELARINVDLGANFLELGTTCRTVHCTVLNGIHSAIICFDLLFHT